MYHSYEIVYGESGPDLGTKVNAKLADGYVPIGGVTVGGGGSEIAYVQAVAKPLLMTAMMLNTAIVPGKEKKKKKKKKDA